MKSVCTDKMDPLPEEQQSQQGTPMNPIAYRSMRDHIHPPRVSAPSCIIPPAEDVAVRPYLVPLLPTFHGMENENPYTHIRDFEEVCITFKEVTIEMDLLKLKAFPLTLKDKKFTETKNHQKLGRAAGRIFLKILQCSQDQ